MKRMIIFSLLGPPLALVVFLLHGSLTASTWPPLSLLVMGIPFAYLLGFIPAWFAGAADWYLASRIRGWRRVLAMMGAGYVITIAYAVLQTMPNLGPLSGLLGFGLVGAIPAAVCSWLSGERQDRTAQ